MNIPDMLLLKNRPYRYCLTLLLILSLRFVSYSQVTDLTPRWKLINTKYPTIDDVVATFSVNDFGTTGDGVTDVTGTFQTLLNKLGQIGGGVLFVPEGKYVIKGNLLFPKGIMHRGEWKKPVKGEPVVGTILMAYSGIGVKSGTLFITMETSAAVMDAILYKGKHQSASPHIHHPFYS